MKNEGQWCAPASHSQQHWKELGKASNQSNFYYRGELQMQSHCLILLLWSTVWVRNRKDEDKCSEITTQKLAWNTKITQTNRRLNPYLFCLSIPSPENFILLLTRWFVATCIRIWLEAAPADGSATCQSHLYQRDISCIGGTDMVLNVPSLLSISTLCCVWRWTAMPL